MDWQEWALKKLQDSLVPIPAELNELDWKSGLSCKTERLAQHISAFANLKGGGILVFGVNNDGICSSITKDEADKTIQLLGNIAKNNLAYSISIEHAILTYQNSTLLFIYIPEQQDKPVSLRGKDVFDSYIRSAGQTVKMSRNQVKAMIAESQGFTFEEQAAKNNLTAEQVLDAAEKYTVGDVVQVTVKSVEGTGAEDVKIAVDVKGERDDPGKAELSRCCRQGKYSGIVTDVYRGTYYLRLDSGVNAIAHSATIPVVPGRGDRVGFVVTRVNPEAGFAEGIITRMIRQVNRE